MRILVISDTHGNYPLALRACELAEPVDTVIHLGDGGDDAGLIHHALGINLIRVAGNCDHGSTGPREMLWECEGKRLLLAHGDRYGVKNGLGRLEQRGIEARADIVLFGHTHCATIITLSGILFVNPGTLMRSERQTTYAVLEISSAGVTANLHEIPTP
jgi:putative phosphoesterase